MKKPSIVVAALLAARAAAAAATSFGLQNDISPMYAHRVAARDSCPSSLTPTNPKTWWRAEIAHNSTTPFSSDGSYQYYRKLSQYDTNPTSNTNTTKTNNKTNNNNNKTNNTV